MLSYQSKLGVGDKGFVEGFWVSVLVMSSFSWVAFVSVRFGYFVCRLLILLSILLLVVVLLEEDLNLLKTWRTWASCSMVLDLVCLVAGGGCKMALAVDSLLGWSGREEEGYPEPLISDISGMTKTPLLVRSRSSLTSSATCMLDTPGLPPSSSLPTTRTWQPSDQVLHH